jgi:PAS domain S-box-containing protein
MEKSALWPAAQAPERAMCDEAERATILAAYGLEELNDDEELTDIARFAAHLCGTKMAAVSIVEEDRQTFVAREGLAERSTPRPTSFCATAMLSHELLIVPDAAQDTRFADFAVVVDEPRIRFYAGAPLVSVEGVPVGALCVIDTEPRPGGLDQIQREGLAVLAQTVMRRLSSQRENLAALQEIRRREQRLFRVLEGLPDVAWSADAEGKFDFFNSRWKSVTGSNPPTNAEEWREFIHPDDQDQAYGKWYDSFGNLKPFEAEFRFRQSDGSWRWVLSRGLPVSEENEPDVRWFGTLTDIDDDHRQSESRELLARELSHRIKNIFAVVSGLISLRSRRKPEVAEFAEELNATIRTLGRAHDYVRPVEGRKGDRLAGLLGDLMAAYDDGTGERVRIAGDDCAIGPRTATPLALVFHELATNSAKYGALSAEEGRIDLTIELQDDNVRIDWRESGGPRLEPGEAGFGSRLVDMAVQGQLGGSLQRDWRPEGLAARLELPLATIRD